MENYPHEKNWYQPAEEKRSEIHFGNVGKCWLDDIIVETSVAREKRSRFDECKAKAKVRAFQKGLKIPDARLTKSIADYLYDDTIRAFVIEEGIDVRAEPPQMNVTLLLKGKPPKTIEKEMDSDEIKIRTTLKDLLLYALFLILLLLVIFSNYTSSSFYLTSAMKKLFVDTEFRVEKGIRITFTEINTVSDIYQYLTKYFKTAIYTQWSRTVGPSPFIDSEDKKNILYENRMFGYCRIKMVRMKGDSCKVNKLFKTYQPYCFNYFRSLNQDEKLFEGVDTTWRHESERGPSISGKFGTYVAEGYLEDIPWNSFDKLDDLESNEWIKRGIRALTVQFTVYNANIQLFCNVLLLFEFPPTGGVYPSYKFSTVKLITVQEIWDYFVLGFEGGLGLFLLYFIIQCIREMTVFGWWYLTFAWHYVDLIIIIGLLAILSLKLMLHLSMLLILNRKDLNKFINFDSVTSIRIWHDDIYGIILFVSWLKLIRFFDFTRVVKKLKSLFFLCALDMVHFLSLVLFFFLAFAETGSVLFGMGLNEYTTLGNSYLTLLRVIAGDTQFDTLQEFDIILGPIYLFLFLIFVINIVLNISVSILNEAYLNMRQIGIRRDAIMSAVHYLKRALYHICRAGRKHVLFRNVAQPTTIHESSIVELLLRHSFSPAEVHAFMAKYKLRQYRISNHLSPERLKRLIYDIKNIDMNSYVPIDFFLHSAKQLKILVEEGEEDILKKMNQQDTKPEDFARIARRLDELDLRYEEMYERIRFMHGYLKRANRPKEKQICDREFKGEKREAKVKKEQKKKKKKK